MDAMKCDGTDSKPDCRMSLIQLDFENPDVRTMQDLQFLQQAAVEGGGQYIEVTFGHPDTLQVRLSAGLQLSGITMELLLNRSEPPPVSPESSTMSQE